MEKKEPCPVGENLNYNTHYGKASDRILKNRTAETNPVVIIAFGS